MQHRCKCKEETPYLAKRKRFYTKEELDMEKKCKYEKQMNDIKENLKGLVESTSEFISTIAAEHPKHIRKINKFVKESKTKAEKYIRCMQDMKEKMKPVYPSYSVKIDIREALTKVARYFDLPRPKFDVSYYVNYREYKGCIEVLENGVFLIASEVTPLALKSNVVLIPSIVDITISTVRDNKNDVSYQVRLDLNLPRLHIVFKDNDNNISSFIMQYTLEEQEFNKLLRDAGVTSIKTTETNTGCKQSRFKSSIVDIDVFKQFLKDNTYIHGKDYKSYIGKVITDMPRSKNVISGHIINMSCLDDFIILQTNYYGHYEEPTIFTFDDIHVIELAIADNGTISAIVLHLKRKVFVIEIDKIDIDNLNLDLL